MKEYEKVGGGTYGLYRPKPKPKSNVGAWLFVGFVILLIIGAAN